MRESLMGRPETDSDVEIYLSNIYSLSIYLSMLAINELSVFNVNISYKLVLPSSRNDQSCEIIPGS